MLRYSAQLAGLDLTTVAATLSFPVFLARTYQGELRGEEQCKREDRTQK